MAFKAGPVNFYWQMQRRNAKRHSLQSLSWDIVNSCAQGALTIADAFTRLLQDSTAALGCTENKFNNLSLDMKHQLNSQDRIFFRCKLRTPPEGNGGEFQGLFFFFF